MIVRIARVKVGNRQAPYPRQDPALKSGVLAFLRPLQERPRLWGDADVGMEGMVFH